MLEPIVKIIEVPCSQEKAFKVFVNDMGSWWPLDKRAMSLKDGQQAKSLHVEAKSGGRIVEIGQNGTEYFWGSFKAFNPYESVSMNFHMGMPPENASLVEVQFTALGVERTRVQLTQSNWEAFGDMAEMLRSHYGPGWVIIFEDGYKAACSK